MRIFQLDSPLMRFLTRVCDLIILNVLWLLCCLPVFTIAPATTALYHVTLHMVDDEDRSIVNDYFHAFRSNYISSLKIWLFLLPLFIVYALIIGYTGIFKAAQSQLSTLLTILTLLPLLFLLFVVTHIFAYTSRYENTTMEYIKNAFLISLLNLPITVLMLILNLMPLAIMLVSVSLFIRVSIFWLLIGFSLTAYINSIMLKKVYAKLDTLKIQSQNENGIHTK